MQPEHRDANRSMWDERVPIHLESEMYDNNAFVAGRNSLEPFEVEEMGPVAGKTLLHLQCHFGQDTLSWARLGATVTGLDFSEPAVEAARQLASQINIDIARFVGTDVYDAVDALGGEQFEVVYTGAGAINWLPDLNRWAAVVYACLAPGGVFYMREFHPARVPWDDDPGVTELRPRWKYFHDEPYRWDEPGTYADRDAETRNNVSYEWNHGLGTVVSALAGAGLRIEFLHEFPYCSYKALPFMVEDEHGSYRLPGDLDGVLPLMYTLRCRKE